MAAKDSSDEAFRQMLDKIEASKKYKVITQEEYEILLAVNTSKDRAGTGDHSVNKPPNASATHDTSTPVTKVPDVVRPKLSFAFPGVTPIPRLQHTSLLNNSQPVNASYIAPSYSQPKLPFFSGSDEPPKGEVSYEVWSYEVKCLQNSHYLPEHVLLYAIRNSLKGSARSLLIPLGESASVTDILHKLDGFYGNVSSSETLMQNFYSDFQKDKESIVEFGSRLEQTLSRAMRGGLIDPVSKDSMLRTKFWTGLNSQSLKNSTRHLFDSIKDFQLLLREIRKVEQEDACSSRTAVKPKIAQQHSSQTSSESDTAQLLKQMNQLMDRMKIMENKLDSQQQSIAAANNPSSFQNTGFRPQYNRPQFNQGRGRGYGRGNFGRGNQNSDTFQHNQNFRGGNFRGGNRGGTIGRGAYRGGNSASGSQPLN